MRFVKIAIAIAMQKSVQVVPVVNVLFVSLILVSQLVLQSGCSHSKTKQPLTKAQLSSKRVAIAEISADGEARKHIEVAIINEVIEKGRFEVVDRASVQDAMVTYPHESDWQRLGKRLEADYILKIRVLDFLVNERDGYDKIEEEDSVLAEESGEPRKKVIGSRYVKVRGYTGTVRLNFRLFDVAQDKVVYDGKGTATDVLNSRDGGLPGKMALLEKLSAKAISDFFERTLQ